MNLWANTFCAAFNTCSRFKASLVCSELYLGDTNRCNLYLAISTSLCNHNGLISLDMHWTCFHLFQKKSLLLHDFFVGAFYQWSIWDLFHFFSRDYFWNKSKWNPKTYCLRLFQSFWVFLYHRCWRGHFPTECCTKNPQPSSEPSWVRSQVILVYLVISLQF